MILNSEGEFVNVAKGRGTGVYASQNRARAALIAAAADLWSGEDELPFWSDRTPAGEYMRGMCELIANATGSDDPDNAKSEAWEEIAAAVRRANLQGIAQKIAAAVIIAEHRRDGEAFPRDWNDVQRIAEAAALQALTHAEKEKK